MPGTCYVVVFSGIINGGCCSHTHLGGLCLLAVSVSVVVAFVVFSLRFMMLVQCVPVNCSSWRVCL